MDRLGISSVRSEGGSRRQSSEVGISSSTSSEVVEGDELSSFLILMSPRGRIGLNVAGGAELARKC